MYKSLSARELPKNKKLSIHDQELPFTRLKEKKPILDRIVYMPANMNNLVTQRIDKGWGSTFAS